MAEAGAKIWRKNSKMVQSAVLMVVLNTLFIEIMQKISTILPEECIQECCYNTNSKSRNIKSR